MKVKLSFCMPVYNREEFITEAIKSVLKTKNPANYELVIVDGGSTDKTHEICMKFARKSKKIKYFRDKKNYGFLDGFKKCIKYAKGEYIFFLPSDDVLLLQNFGPLLKILDNDKEIGVMGTNLRLFTTSLKNYSKNHIFFSKSARFKAGEDAFIRWLHHSSLASVGGTIFRSNLAKKFIDKVTFAGYFPMLHLAVLILNKFDAYHYNIISFAQRQSNQENQLANKQYKSMIVFEELFKITELIPLPEDKIKSLKKRIIMGYFHNIISMRCYSNSKTFWQFVNFLIKNNWLVLLQIKFWIYMVLALFVPRRFLFQFLLYYRGNKKKFEPNSD